MLGKPRILRHYFYILTLSDISNPKVLHYYFAYRNLAKYHIQLNFRPKERKYFKIVSGKYIKKYNPTIDYTIKLRIRKYEYPKLVMTRRERGEFQKRELRKLRRLGLLIKNQRLVGSVKAIRPNIQFKKRGGLVKPPGKLHKNDFSLIRIERHGKHKLFKVLALQDSKRKGNLCILKTVYFNFKKQTHTYKEVRLKNTDTIRAVKIRKLLELCEKNNIKVHEDLWIDYCKQNNLPFNDTSKRSK